MDLKLLKDTPPWDWPEDAGKIFLETLQDGQADSSDRVLAAEMAGDFTVINDELVVALLSILGSSDESEELRGKAAISLGPALEHADTDGFDNPDDVPISEDTFHRIQKSLHRLYLDAGIRSVAELATRDPVELVATLRSFVDETGFEGIAPLAGEARHAVETARSLKPVIDW